MHGDTDNTPMGWGTYGSRTTAVGGAALAVATRKIKEKAKLLAGHLLEAAVEDMDYADGKFFVKGSPDKAKTIQDIALMANVAWNMPQGMEAGPRGVELLRPAELRLSVRRAHRGRRGRRGNRPRRAEALRRRRRLRPQINPVIVEGQVHGGVVQGIGQALWEEAVYDENGQLLTGSMLDYAHAARRHAARHQVLSTVTPSPHHPLGVKGIGEAGTIASTVHGLQRRHRRARAARGRAIADAADAGACLAGHQRCQACDRTDAIGQREPDACIPSISTTTAPARSPTFSGSWPQHPGAKLLAGGHSLIPLLKLRLAAPTALIDIGRVAELRGHLDQGGTLRIGALTTHAELATSADVRDARAGVGRRGRDRRRSGGAGIAARSAATSRTPIRPRICRRFSSRSTHACRASARTANEPSPRTSSSRA